MSAKVLLALHDIQDLGGIINWVEHLCHGLKELGAEPTLVRLENKSKCKFRSTTKATRVGYSGIPYSQAGGWNFPTKSKVPLMATDWKKYTKNYDLLIWVVPVPSKVSLWDGWESLYAEPQCAQIMVVHDGNLNKMYPHAYSVMDKCDLVVGVHDCAFNSIKTNDTTKALIPNPQISRMQEIFYKYRDGVFSLQTFKRWKRVDDLVRAVPYIKSTVKLAGGGIEYHYMAGTKQKPEYKGIWKNALDHGMQYLGYIPEMLRDEHLTSSMLLIDPSWSKGYAEHGSHFNRTFVDAIIAGCMPAARDLLMDKNTFFEKGDYITIPYNCSPEEFGEIVNEALTIPERTYTKHVRNLQKQVDKWFDSIKVAQQYLNVIGG